MIIVCANVKGGTGKSCLAQNLAVYLQVIAGKKVLLVDGDPQETTADWIQERRESGKLADIRFAKMTGDIYNDLLDMEDKFDAVIVDCGGHDSKTMRYALTAATHALIPFRPKRRDLKLLPQMEEIISTVKTVNTDCKFVSVINQAPPLPSQAYRIMQAKEACASFDLPTLNTVIMTRNIYDDADEEGSSIFEMATVDKKAIAEITALAKEFIFENAEISKIETKIMEA